VGINDPAYTTGILTSTTYYQCIISQTGYGCDLVVSNCIAVNVNPDITITNQPLGDTICTGGTIIMSVSASGGTGLLNFQWQSASDCGGPWTDVGTNLPDYTAQNLSSDEYYQCIITATGAGCDPVISNCAKVTVVPGPVINIQPVGDTICEGGLYSMSVSVSGGTGVLHYQWQSAPDCSGPWTDVGMDNATYVTIPLLVTTCYRSIISQAGVGCNLLTSACASVVVFSDPLITVQPAGASICSGETHTMTLSATGGTGIVNYQWQSAPACNGPWTNIGLNASVYVSDSLFSDTFFHCIVYVSGFACDPDTSICAAVLIGPPVSAPSSIHGPNNRCEGVGTNYYTSTASNATGYLWTITNAGMSSIDSANGTVTWDPTFSGIATISVIAYGCGGPTGPVTLDVTVFAIPTVNLGPDQLLCANGNVLLNAGSYADYLWSTGESTQTVIIDTSGIGIGTANIWVRVTDINNCIGQDTVSITFDPCTGISALAEMNDIYIYPVPSNGVFNLQFSEPYNGETSILVFDMMGNLIYKSFAEIKSNTLKVLDLSDKAKGVYLLHIISESKTLIKKLVLD
jgi:hypothetical protein